VSPESKHMDGEFFFIYSRNFYWITYMIYLFISEKMIKFYEQRLTFAPAADKKA